MGSLVNVSYSLITELQVYAPARAHRSTDEPETW